MPCDRFWAVAAKKAHLAVLVRVLVLWCGLRVAGCGLRVAGCGLRGWQGGAGQSFCAAWARFSYGWGILCVEGCPCAMFVLGLLVSLYIDQHG